jgi:hypothetical protein
MQIKEILIFPGTIDTDKFYFLSPNAFKKLKLVRSQIFFHKQPNFSAELTEKFCKSWQHLQESTGNPAGLSAVLF